MAQSTISLDIRANTSRAINEFKKFSSQLDNKFLVSGLKLDVVRNALGQINREFNKAIGEQGLSAGTSLRQAQNQAAMLARTFKNFSSEASLEMSKRFSESFNQIAVDAGGTAEDIKKALNATPWISIDLPEQIRMQMGEAIAQLQIGFRQAGSSKDFGALARDFLMGEITARQLIDSGDPLSSEIGKQLQNRSGTDALIPSSEMRSRVLLDTMTDPKLLEMLSSMETNATRLQTTIEKLNAYLFNPEKGVFGVLREVTSSVGDKTNILRETQELIESVFGRQGFFVTFFTKIGKIFGLEDPLKVVVNGIMWMTRQFNRLTAFLEHPRVQSIINTAKEAVEGVLDFLRNVYDGLQEFSQTPQAQALVDGVGTLFNNIFSAIGEFSKSKEAEEIAKTAGRGFRLLLDGLKSILGILNNEGNISAVKETLSKITFATTGLFNSIFDTIESGEWDPTKINDQVKKIGEGIRSFISSIGESFRSADASDQAAFFSSTIGTILEEIGETVGLALRELVSSIFSKNGLAIVLGVAEALNKALSGLFSGLFDDKGIGALLGGVATAGIFVSFARRIVGVLGGLIINALNSVFGAGLVNSVRRRFGINLFSPGGPGGPGGGGPGRPNAAPWAAPRIPPNGPTSDQVRNRYLGAPGRLWGRITGRGAPVGRTGYSAPIGPLQLNSADPWAFDPSGAATPRLDSASTQRGWRGGVGRRAAIGQFVRRPLVRGLGRGALIAGIGAGIIGLASSAKSAEIDPATGQPKVLTEEQQIAKEKQQNKLGGFLSSAANGAMIGAMVGPWGAAIGGVIGGGIALMDKDTRSAVGEWGKGVWKAVKEGAIKFGGFLNESLGNLGEFLKRFFLTDLPQLWLKGMKFIYVDLPNKVTAMLSNFVSELGKELMKALRANPLVNGILNALGIRDSSTPPPPRDRSVPDASKRPNLRRGNFAGLNHFGPELAQESRMSGSRALIVNEKEFVIPTNGFNTLADLVANRALAGGSNRGGNNISATFNVSMAITGVENTTQLGSSPQFKEAVVKVLNEAWTEVTSGTIDRGTSVI